MSKFRSGLARDKVLFDQGGCYVLEEERPKRSFRLFSELIGMKRPGLVITRQYPDHVRRVEGLKDVRIIWLSHTPGQDFHDPNAIGELAKVIQKFIEDHEGAVVVLLDGLEYLVVNNGFPRTLTFIEHVNELATKGTAIVLLPVNPASLQNAELTVLKRNLKVLDPSALRIAVRFIPERPGLLQECRHVGSSLAANSDIDDGPAPLEEKIRVARRSLIPFIVLVSGEEARSGTLHVLHYQGSETWMSLESARRAIKDWEASGG